jgi:hypothetical protein
MTDFLANFYMRYRDLPEVQAWFTRVKRLHPALQERIQQVLKPITIFLLQISSYDGLLFLPSVCLTFYKGRKIVSDHPAGSTNIPKIISESLDEISLERKGTVGDEF